MTHASRWLIIKLIFAPITLRQRLEGREIRDLCEPEIQLLYLGRFWGLFVGCHVSQQLDPRPARIPPLGGALAEVTVSVFTQQPCV